jgi:hypothetical protein
MRFKQLKPKGEYHQVPIGVRKISMISSRRSTYKSHGTDIHQPNLDPNQLFLDKFGSSHIINKKLNLDEIYTKIKSKLSF